MAISTIRGARIAGVTAVVPPGRRRIDDEAESLGGPAQVERLKQTIGLDERRVVEGGTTAADLCFEAAVALLEGLGTGRKGIEGLVLVTQTPDHFQPATAACLHGRLELESSCAAFDVNLGCSGYVYGLWLAHMMVSSGLSNVLLLAGDTMSRCVHPRDRAVAPLFGDAGTATLVVRDATGDAASFNLWTDGKGAGYIMMPGGAFRRERAGEAGLVVDESGNVKSPDHLNMNGAEVFNFTLRVVPRAVRAALETAGLEADDVDAFVFHQANRYIIQNVVRRLRIPPSKAPAGTVERYGNQSSASIPVTLCDALGKDLRGGSRRLLLCGFGVGLSWASCVLRAGPVFCPSVLEAAAAAAG